MTTMNQAPKIKISARNICKTYNPGSPDAVEAINGLSLDVTDGELVSLLGPSGCGKSTFLYMVGGFEEHTSGTLTLDGDEIRGPGPNRGIVFQEYVLFPWQTVARNIEYGLRINKTPKTKRQARVRRTRKHDRPRGVRKCVPFQTVWWHAATSLDRAGDGL